jgi:acid stress-induced BolA-like protein IbaG/YrbA
MQPEEIKQLIEAGIPGSTVIVKVDEGGHLWVTVVSDTFAGKTPLNKERMVHASLGDAVTSGAIHAIHIKSYTPDEWTLASKMQVS